MLLPIENVLSADEVLHFRQQLATAPWQDGKASAGSQAMLVKDNLQLDDRSETAQTLRNFILARLASHPDFIAAALPKKIFPPKFNCYQHGGHYGLHVDGAIMTLPDGQAMRTDLSVTLFLCDPDEYEGGELVIDSHLGVQEVKLAAGDLILYPSTSLHEVRPVTAGARICSFFWLESMVRQASRRETLYDLDQSIQQLTRERGGDDSEVRRLSWVYHNLLREWAES